MENDKVYTITVPIYPNIQFGISLPLIDGSVIGATAQFRKTEDCSLFDLVIGEEPVIRGVPLLVDSPLFIRNGYQLVFKRKVNEAQYVVNWETMNTDYELVWQPLYSNLTEAKG